jgi:hypothetical protein
MWLLWLFLIPLTFITLVREKAKGVIYFLHIIPSGCMLMAMCILTSACFKAGSHILGIIIVVFWLCILDLINKEICHDDKIICMTNTWHIVLFMICCWNYSG